MWYKQGLGPAAVQKEKDSLEDIGVCQVWRLIFVSSGVILVLLTIDGVQETSYPTQ